MKRDETLRWEEPPPLRQRRNGTDWDSIGRALRAKPGKWARVLAVDSAPRAALIGSQIRNGTYAALRPASAFEAAARTVDGEHYVYARYVGDGAS